MEKYRYEVAAVTGAGHASRRTPARVAAEIEKECNKRAAQGARLAHVVFGLTVEHATPNEPTLATGRVMAWDRATTGEGAHYLFFEFPAEPDTAAPSADAA